MHDLGAGATSTYKKSARVVDHAYDSRAIAPAYAYDAICNLNAPWKVHVRLVDGHGNLGGPDDDDLPASPRYTEARLSRAGALAVAAEHGEVPRLPIGLINGDVYVAGTAPAFAPERVIAAVLLAGAEPRVPNAELCDVVGPPSFPTGCNVEGDFAALAAGEAIGLELIARVSTEQGRRGPQFVVTNPPVGTSIEQIEEGLTSRSRLVIDRKTDAMPNTYPGLANKLGIALRQVRKEPYGATICLVCELKAGADVDKCRAQVLETWPVRVPIRARLAHPLAALIRAVVDDPPAQRAALQALQAAL
jgi:DNA gyrase/topoisomerase IV subunit A